MNRLSKRARKFLNFFAILALTALSIWGRQYLKGRQGREWVALTEQRRVNLIARTLPSFAAFFSRNGGGWRTELLTEMNYGGYRENYTDVLGLLVNKDRNVGSAHIKSFFHGWEAEPRSAEFTLTLTPLAIQDLTGDLKQFADLALKQGSADWRRGDMEWIGSPGEKGSLIVRFLVPFPCRWMEDIPDYNRGYSDEFRFSVVRRAVKLVYQQAVISEYTPLALQLPSYNPPTYVSDLPVGGVRGYFRDKDRLIPIDIEASCTTGWFPETTLTIQIGATNGADSPGTSEQDLASIIKPEFLAKLKSEPGGDSYDNNLSMRKSSDGRNCTITINCRLDRLPDFP